MKDINTKKETKLNKDNSGMAMMIVFIIILVMIPIGLTLIYLLQPEAVFTMQQKKTTETISIAEAGANDSMSRLMIEFQRVIPTKVASISTDTLQGYTTSIPLATLFLSAHSTNFDNIGGNAVLYTTGTVGSGGVYYSTLTISADSDPFGDGNKTVTNPQWDNISKSAVFYYNFKIRSTGEMGDHKTTILLDSRDIADTRQNIRATGSFEVGVTKSFARFACFTGVMKDLRGVGDPRTWLAGFNYLGKYYGTEYYGPVHTNDQLNIAFFPKFHNYVTSVSSYVWYWNNSDPNKGIFNYIESTATSNGSDDVPDFTNPLGLNPSPLMMKEVPEIALPTNPGDIDDLRDYAWNTTQAIHYPGVANGIYLPNDGTPTGGFSGILTGGILAEGDVAEINFRPDTYAGDNFCVYEIIQDTTTNDGKVIAINVSKKETWIQDYDGWAWGGVWTKYQEQPNGVLFVNDGTTVTTSTPKSNGSISSLFGELQRDTQLTIAAVGDITITDDILYEGFEFESTSPVITDHYDELLGVISWKHNITISSAIPHNDLDLYGTFLTPKGQLQVEDYESLPLKGDLMLYGGIIGKGYGKVGKVYVSGYNRISIWDPRFTSLAPPKYPTTTKYSVTVKDINFYPLWRIINE